MWFALYVLIAVVCWVPLYKGLYRHTQRTWPSLEWTNGDRIFGVLWGGVVVMCWPLFLPLAIIAWLVVKARPLLEKLEN